MVANLHTNKDHETALRAWRSVVRSMADVGRNGVLLLAGRFDDTHLVLKALAHDLDLGRSVCFLGPVDDVSGLLACADIGVFSSRSEGVPNGVLECMAAGLAVAATDIPSIREAVGQQGSSFLSPPGDEASLAEQILKLAFDPSLRQRVGTANCLRIEQEFSPEEMYRRTVELIHGSLSSHD